MKRCIPSTLVEHVAGASRLVTAVAFGPASAGKLLTLRFAREAWEAQGFRVRGITPSSHAADELQAGSGIESRTIHSLEHGWNRGKDPLTSRDVLVMDEAETMGNQQLGRVLAAADTAGIRAVVLIGREPLNPVGGSLLNT